MDKIEYTAKQLERAAELWRRIVELFNSHTQEDPQGYGYHGTSYLPKDKISDEWITELVKSNGEATEDYAAINVSLMSYGYGYGSHYDAANIRELEGMPGITTDIRDSSGSATMQLGELPEEETVDDGLERLEVIARMLENLDDYPVFSDESISDYEHQLADEAWDAWLRHDIVSDLERVALDGWEITDGVESELRAAYYEYEGNEWYATDAISVHNGRHDDALAHVARVVLGWDYPKRKRKYDARQQAARKQAAEREARWEADRAAYRAAWRDYLAAYPLPYFGDDGPSHWTLSNAWQGMFDRGLLPATVDSIREYVRTESEHAAYRENATR